MSQGSSHLSSAELIHLRDERLDTAGQLRAALHLARCPECVRFARRLWPTEDEPLAEEPVAQAIRRLAEPAAWPVLGAAHVEALDGVDRVDAVRGGFLNVLIEEAVVLALENGSIETFSLPIVATEIFDDLDSTEASLKLRRRVLIRRGYAAAVLGLPEVAKTSLEHAVGVGPEIEDALLDADLLEACGRFLHAMGGDPGDRYIAARQLAKEARAWLRELELHLASVGTEVDDADSRHRAIAALEEAKQIQQKIPPADIRRRRAALMMRSTFTAELAASCQRHGLDPPNGLESVVRKLDEARWIDDAGAWVVGRRELSRGHLLLALDEADAAREAFFRAIETYTHVGASQPVTAAFLGLVQHHRSKTDRVHGQDLDRLFRLVEDRLGLPSFHQFMSRLVTCEQVRKTASRPPQASALAVAS